jgi:thiol-disulfide isomerase/thioredoxin
MKLSHLVLLAILVYGGMRLKNRVSGPAAPAVSFADVDGKTRDFRKLERPMAVGFWIENCPYCANAMAVLKSVRQENAAEKLDVVGFFLNARSAPDVASLGAREGYWVTLAAAQPPTDLIRALHSSFGIRGPGRDIYVIDRSGRYSVVSTVDGSGGRRPESEIKAEVTARLKDVLKNG